MTTQTNNLVMAAELGFRCAEKGWNLQKTMDHVHELLGPLPKVKCTHPDHEDGKSCTDYAVGCHVDCECCIPQDQRPQFIAGWVFKYDNGSYCKWKGEALHPIDHSTVNIHDADFYLSYTEAPPAHAREPGRWVRAEKTVRIA